MKIELDYVTEHGKLDKMYRLDPERERERVRFIVRIGLQAIVQSIYILFLSVSLFVCLYPIIVKKAEPSGPNFVWDFT